MEKIEKSSLDNNNSTPPDRRTEVAQNWERSNNLPLGQKPESSRIYYKIEVINNIKLYLLGNNV